MPVTHVYSGHHEIQRGPWDDLDPSSPSLKVQPACDALSRRGIFALITNTTSTGTAKANGRSQEPVQALVYTCIATIVFRHLEEAMAPVLATETKYSRWLLARFTLAPYSYYS